MKSFHGVDQYIYIFEILKKNDIKFVKNKIELKECYGIWQY
jgi:hypothetical protein